jgi:hypothetical protein
LPGRGHAERAPQASWWQEHGAAHDGGPRAQQAGKLETRALFAGSQGGTVARAGGNPSRRTAAAATSMAFAEFPRQSIVECHFLDNQKRCCDLRVNEYTAFCKEEYETQAGRTEAPTARSPVAETVERGDLTSPGPLSRLHMPRLQQNGFKSCSFIETAASIRITHSTPFNRHRLILCR